MGFILSVGPGQIRLQQRGYEFPVDLMLLLFNEIDVILGMDWLIEHDTTVNCRKKQIVLRCQNNELVNIET